MVIQEGWDSNCSNTKKNTILFSRLFRTVSWVLLVFGCVLWFFVLAVKEIITYISGGNDRVMVVTIVEHEFHANL